MTTIPQNNTKPLIVFLPGFMGTTLRSNTYDIWSENIVENILTRFLKDPDKLVFKANDQVEVGTPIKNFQIAPKLEPIPVYGNLLNFLTGLNAHQVLPHGYDWRQDIQETAKLLAEDIANHLQNQPRPIGIIAHSQGGVLARIFFHAFSDDKRFNLRQNLKLFIQIGSPIQGTLLAYRLLLDQPEFKKVWDVGDSVFQASAQAIFPRIEFIYRRINKAAQTMPSLYQLLPPLSEKPLRITKNGGRITKELSCFDQLPSEIEKAKTLNNNIHRLLERPLTDFNNLIIKSILSEEHETDYILEVNEDGTVKGKAIKTAGDDSVIAQSAEFQSPRNDYIRLVGPDTSHFKLCNNKIVMQQIQEAYSLAFI